MAKQAKTLELRSGLPSEEEIEAYYRSLGWDALCLLTESNCVCLPFPGYSKVDFHLQPEDPNINYCYFNNSTAEAIDLATYGETHQHIFYTIKNEAYVKLLMKYEEDWFSCHSIFSSDLNKMFVESKSNRINVKRIYINGFADMSSKECLIDFLEHGAYIGRVFQPSLDSVGINIYVIEGDRNRVCRQLIPSEITTPACSRLNTSHSPTFSNSTDIHLHISSEEQVVRAIKLAEIYDELENEEERED